VSDVESRTNSSSWRVPSWRSDFGADEGKLGKGIEPPKGVARAHSPIPIDLVGEQLPLWLMDPHHGGGTLDAPGPLLVYLGNTPFGRDPIGFLRDAGSWSRSDLGLKSHGSRRSVPPRPSPSACITDIRPLEPPRNQPTSSYLW